MSIIYSLFVFLIVILVHEFGHFIVAKLNNIRVNEFSIGMGPKLLSKQGEETFYTLRALPIGGYVALEGEDDESDDPRSFNRAHPLKRIAVLFAGAFMNFLLAIILFSFIFLIVGSPSDSTVIGDIMENSPAVESSLEVGDRIINIDNNPIESWNDISKVINESKKDELIIEFERNGETLNTTINPVNDGGNYIIGITPVYEKNIGSAISSAFTNTKTVILQVYEFIGNLITGQANISALSGPVGIVRMIGSSSQQGIFTLLTLAAIISANLGAFNLLPFPALDGGTIYITFIEMIIGKEVPDKVKIGLNVVGLSLLLGLILYVTVFNDILGGNRIG